MFRIPSLYFLVTSVHKRNRGFSSLPTFLNCAPNFTRPISPTQSHPPNLTQSQCSQPSAPTLPTLATVPTPDPTFTTWQCFDSSSTTLLDGDVLRTTSPTNCWQRHLCISCRRNKVALQKLKTEVPHPIQQEKKRKEKQIDVTKCTYLLVRRSFSSECRIVMQKDRMSTEKRCFSLFLMNQIQGEKGRKTDEQFRQDKNLEVTDIQVGDCHLLVASLTHQHTFSML